jgi:hypothetical protein
MAVWVKTNYRMVVKDLRRGMTHAVKQVVINTHKRLVAPPSEGGTPVKTGFARSNWLIGIGGPRGSTVGSPSAVASLSSPAKALAGYTLRHGNVYITNNVSYIVDLNDGSSRQAPAAFVQRAIDGAISQDLGAIRA